MKICNSCKTSYNGLSRLGSGSNCAYGAGGGGGARGWSLILGGNAKERVSRFYFSRGSHLCCLFTSELKKKPSQCLTKLNGRKARIHRNCSMDVIYFSTEEISARQKNLFISWNCAKESQSSEESQRGGKLVRNLKIFWLNNEIYIYIAFGFRMMWRIMQISEDFIRWGWRPSIASFASSFILSRNLLLRLRDNTHLTQREIVFNSRDLVLREY